MENIISNHKSMASEQIGECSAASQRPENIKTCTSARMFGNEIRTATLKNNNVLIVVCFVAKWSEKCNYMEEFINHLAEREEKVVFLKVDIDDLKALAWRWMIATVPTYMLVKRENLVLEIQGMNKKALVDAVLRWKSRRVLQGFPDKYITNVETDANTSYIAS